jgi:hypothetical protein
VRRHALKVEGAYRKSLNISHACLDAEAFARCSSIPNRSREEHRFYCKQHHVVFLSSNNQEQHRYLNFVLFSRSSHQIQYLVFRSVFCLCNLRLLPRSKHKAALTMLFLKRWPPTSYPCCRSLSPPHSHSICKRAHNLDVFPANVDGLKVLSWVSIPNSSWLLEFKVETRSRYIMQIDLYTGTEGTWALSLPEFVNSFASLFQAEVAAQRLAMSEVKLDFYEERLNFHS